MVLESIISPENAENRPWLMVGLGFLYTALAMLLSYFIFEAYSSLFTVFLATIASVPVIYKIMKSEEQKDLQDIDERSLLKEHSKALGAFMYLFLGSTLAFAFFYVVLPSSIVSTLFQSQTSTISAINGRVTESGNLTGGFTGLGAFTKIFFNNVKVLIFCILFSFLYGAGAIFILIWNASVVGTAMGNFIRTSIDTVASSCSATAGATFCAVSIGLLKYVVHGIPEILAYFVAALAGGIISIAVINHEFSTRKFEHILLDSADLILLSIAILFIAALLEVYVTPSLGFDKNMFNACAASLAC